MLLIIIALQELIKILEYSCIKLNIVGNTKKTIRREIKNLFVRTNMLISRFYKCSSNVKLTLFKSFCMTVYDVALIENNSCCFQ